MFDIRTDMHLGVWTNISGDVYNRDITHISRGRRDMASNTDPATLTLTLNNKGGKYSTRNAMSPLYGMIGRNTRIRVSVPSSGDHYLQLEGSAADYVATPDTAALDLTGDIDVRAELAPSWYGVEDQTIIGKWDVATDQRSWYLRIARGVCYFHWSTAGTSASAWFASCPLPDGMPERAAIRVTHDHDNGAAGSTTTFYWASSLAGPWTEIDAAVLATDLAPIHAGTAQLRIGPVATAVGASAPRVPFVGRGYRFEVRNGIGGTIVAAPDFRALTAGSTGFTDSAGRVWSVVGAAEIRDREDRFVGEVSDWPIEWDTSDSDVWTSLKASGLLRRLGQGQKPLDSTLRRRIPFGNPIAYWPMEEADTATMAYSPVEGVRPAAVTGIKFGALNTLVSSNALPQISAAGTFSGSVPQHASGEWQVECVITGSNNIPPLAGPYAEVLAASSPDGTVRRWVVTARADYMRLQGFDADGDVYVNQIVPMSATVGHEWVRLRFWARNETGGNMSVRFAVQDLSGDIGGVLGTVVGSAGRLSAITATWGALTQGWGIGHITVLPVADNGLMTGSDRAYTGELAWSRMVRLAEEEGVPLSFNNGPLPTARVGYQRPDQLLSLLHAAAEADGGFLGENPRRVGLHYRDRSSLYTQEPALTLSYTAPGLGPDIRPVDDDRAIRNDITVTRDGGSAGRARLDTGPLSVGTIGLYDESLTLSLADDTQPEQVANWRLHLGTYDGARYPVVSIMLHKPGAEAHIPAVLALREGDVIRLTNLPPWVAHGDVDLLVQGWSERIDLERWELEYNCAPAGPWMVARVDHPVYGKADTDGSALALPAGETDSALTVRTTAGPVWTDDPKETPFAAVLGGEVVRVNTVGTTVTPSDPFFDAGNIAGWLVDSSTLAYSTAFVHPRGTGALAITPSGSAVSGGASSPMSAAGSVIPGATYRAGMWVYSPSGMADVQPTVHWYNAAGTYISTGGLATGYAVPAGQWVYLATDLAAPVNASRARMRPRFGATPPAVPFYVWAPRAVSPSGLTVSDSFTRTVTGGWGTADTGQAWTCSGGTLATDYDVTANTARHSHTARNLFHVSSLDTPALTDAEVLVKVTVPVAAAGDGIYTFVLLRANAAVTTFYFARLFFNTTGGAQLSIRKRLPTETVLATAPTNLPYAAGSSFWIRLRVEGSVISARAWNANATEPSVWTITATDASLTASGGSGVRSFISTTNTNTLPVVVSFDDFRITDVQRFAVTRSANKVIKSHVAGTPLALATPAIASL